MDKNFDGFHIEWDDNKNEINKHKHGISFESAGWIFSDEARLEFYDDIHSIDEDRYITIGKVDDVLFVVFTERDDGDTIRLISARLATAKERRLYYGNS